MPQLFQFPKKTAPADLPQEAPNRPLGRDWLSDAVDAIMGGLGLADPLAPEASKATQLGGLIGAASPLAGMAALGKAARAKQAVTQPLKSASALGAAEDLPVGFTAYHGSPHDFDQFSMSKIGTGEGAQAYGHGLYFAGNEAVAKQYRGDLSNPWDATIGGKPIRDVYRDLEAAAAKMPVDDAAPLYNRMEFLDSLAGLESDGVNIRRKSFTEALRGADPETRLWAQSAQYRPPGNTYEVRIKADPSQFLDWDKPLSQQSEHVRKALERDWLAHPVEHANQTGRQIYDATALGQRDVAIGRGRVADTTMPAAQSAASRELQNAGIPGIRYLDQGSRGAGQGTSNYVVFDDSLIEILRKYGILLPAAGLTGAALAQPGKPGGQ